LGLGRQDRDLRGVSGQAGVVEPCPGDVDVREAFSFAATPPHSEKNHLLVPDTLGCFKPEDPDIAEVGGEDLTTFGQSVTRDNKYQNTTGLQPAIRVAQECRLCATTVSRPKGPIIRGIQIEETKAFDSAMHFQCIALDYVGNPLPGLVSTVGIELDPVAKHLGAAGDRLEGHSVAYAWIER
jgi:hypothetical protein